MKSRKQFLKLMRKKYKKLKKRHLKTKLINQVEEVLLLNRKDVIRRLNSHRISDKRKKLFRKHKYTIDLLPALEKIWIASGYACSKRLRPIIPAIIDNLKRFDELKLSNNQEILLTRISTGTIDSFLHSSKRKILKRKGLTTTRRSPFY